MFPDGVEGQKGVVGFQSNSDGFKADYVRVIADDDTVAVYARSEGFGPTATIGFDLFRAEDGKIVEHWDVIAPMPGPDAENNHSGKF
jgi:predicted SnoaL-like aldol condensation-catalyzing enzyme